MSMFPNFHIFLSMGTFLCKNINILLRWLINPPIYRGTACLLLRFVSLFVTGYGLSNVLRSINVWYVTNRGTNVTGDKRYHGIYVVHQTEGVVLSDGSVLRYAMSQRQADTQNTKSNIPPVWKTAGISRGVNDICNTTLHRAYDNTKKKILHRA